MKISFNPLNSNKNILDLIKNNKDIIFDLKGHRIFARGVEFKGTDTNTWRPVVDNLTSDSTTSSLSAKQGKVLKALIDGKSNSDHNHDGRYVRYYAVTTLDCNNLAAGLTSARISATNAAHTNHSAYLYISDVATPFQIQIPDSSIPYIYKRYYGSGKWSGWFKLNAGYADSAGSVAWANVTGKPSSYTPSAHTHAWNSLTHSSTTENQAILTNGKANGWKLQTLNIARWDNAANNAHSHANKSVLDGITSALVNSWNTAYNFVSNITGTDTDKVINKWEEIVNFLAGITEDNKLNTLLNSKLSIQQLSAKDILTTKTNNALFWVDTEGNASTITTGPFTDHPYALLSVTNYNQNAKNYKFFYRSRLAFNSVGDIKVASCHHEYEYQQDETWYNVLTSKNSGINGSTIKLNGTSITVYSSGTADGRYVKKSGDTMSGALIIDTTKFGALIIKRNNDVDGASIQFRGKSSVYGYIGLNNSTKDKQFLRWSSDTSRVYTILDTSSTYISNGKGVINGTTITQVDNATKLQTARRIWGQSFNGTADVDNTLRIRHTTGNYCEGIRIQTGDGAWSTIILGATSDSGTNTNAWSIHRKSDNNFAISRNSSNGTNGLVMTSVGMGLGTTSPTQRLDVNGNIRTTGNLYISHATNDNMNHDTSNPRIVFSESGKQAVGLVYTDYDSYRASKGLKVMDVDNNDPGNVWFEVQGYNYSSGYVKNGSNNNYVLLGGGGHKAESSLSVSYAASAGNAKTLGGMPRNYGQAPFNTIPCIGGDGVMDIGRYIDYHYDNSGSYDFSTRLQATGNYKNVVNLPSASGTLALTSNILNPTDYYWANVKISTSSSTTTSPTVSNLTATNSIKMGNILLEHTDEINNITNNGSLNLNCRNSGDVSLCAGGGKVGIGTKYPEHELYVMGYTNTKGFGINPYYLSDSRSLPTISPGDGYTYRCLKIGRPTIISCIIADKTYLPGSMRGVLLNFNEGFDGQLVLLKDLQSYGSGNGYFWVMPSMCKILRSDTSGTLVDQGQISNIYDDGRSRFFIYSSKYRTWLEFLCSKLN